MSRSLTALSRMQWPRKGGTLATQWQCAKRNATNMRNAKVSNLLQLRAFASSVLTASFTGHRGLTQDAQSIENKRQQVWHARPHQLSSRTAVTSIGLCMMHPSTVRATKQRKKKHTRKCPQ